MFAFFQCEVYKKLRIFFFFYFFIFGIDEMKNIRPNIKMALNVLDDDDDDDDYHS